MLRHSGALYKVCCDTECDATVDTIHTFNMTDDGRNPPVSYFVGFVSPFQYSSVPILHLQVLLYGRQWTYSLIHSIHIFNNPDNDFAGNSEISLASIMYTVDEVPPPTSALTGSIIQSESNDIPTSFVEGTPCGWH